MQISSRLVMFVRLSLGNTDFQLPSKDFSMGLRSGDWLGHSRTLNASTKPLLHCPGGVFGIIVMLKDPATFHLQCPCRWKEVFTQNLTITWPHSFFSFTQIQSSWFLCRKTAPKHDVPPPCFTVVWCSLDATQHSFSSKHDKLSFYQKVLLVSSDHMTFSQSSLDHPMLSSKLQTGLDMYWLKQGDTSGTAGFESLAAQCVTDVAFVTLVPALCRSFTRSPRVVLGFLLTVLVIILTPRGEILRGSPDRGRLSVVLYVLSIF